MFFFSVIIIAEERININAKSGFLKIYIRKKQEFQLF